MVCMVVGCVWCAWLARAPARTLSAIPGRCTPPARARRRHPTVPHVALMCLVCAVDVTCRSRSLHVAQNSLAQMRRSRSSISSRLWADSECVLSIAWVKRASEYGCVLYVNCVTRELRNTAPPPGHLVLSVLQYRSEKMYYARYQRSFCLFRRPHAGFRDPVAGSCGVDPLMAMSPPVRTPYARS